jgi:ABC-type glycerol-3-phosphate transport system permease component
MSTTAIRRRRPATTKTVVVWGCLLVFVLVAVLPFFYVLSSSLKPGTSLFSYPPQWIPTHITFSNYRDALDRGFARWTLNTLFVCGTVTLLKLAMDSMAAFAFALLPFRGRGALFGSMLATVMIPPAVLIIPLFFLVRDLGLLNSYWALILPPLANPIGIFMLRGFVRSLPDDIASAARLDGCGWPGTYRHVVLPLIRPGLIVVGIYTFLIQYINFAWPLVATTSEHLYMITTGLASLRTRDTNQDFGLISAASVLAMVPITVVFLLFQRRFMAAPLVGALKD